MVFFAHGGISIKLFVLYLHIINECLSYKIHPYSILTGHTKVESVAYWVLNENLFRTDQSNRQISWEKKSGFVDSGFVETCDELVIG